RSIVLASSDCAPRRPLSASLPPLRNSSRHRYSVCSDIPARRAICTAGSSLLNSRTTTWARCSALNVHFFPISPLLLRNTTSSTDLRVQRNRSYTEVEPVPIQVFHRELRRAPRLLFQWLDDVRTRRPELLISSVDIRGE